VARLLLSGFSLDGQTRPPSLFEHVIPLCLSSELRKLLAQPERDFLAMLLTSGSDAHSAIAVAFGDHLHQAVAFGRQREYSFVPEPYCKTQWPWLYGTSELGLRGVHECQVQDHASDLSDSEDAAPPPSAMDRSSDFKRGNPPPDKLLPRPVPDWLSCVAAYGGQSAASACVLHFLSLPTPRISDLDPVAASDRDSLSLDVGATSIDTPR